MLTYKRIWLILNTLINIKSDTLLTHLQANQEKTIAVQQIDTGQVQICVLQIFMIITISN